MESERGPRRPQRPVVGPAGGQRPRGCSEPIGQPGSRARSRSVPSMLGPRPVTFGTLVNPGGGRSFPWLGTSGAATWRGLRAAWMRRPRRGPSRARRRRCSGQDGGARGSRDGRRDASKVAPLPPRIPRARAGRVQCLPSSRQHPGSSVNVLEAK